MEYLLIALICGHLNGCELVTQRFVSETECVAYVETQNNGRRWWPPIDDEHFDCVPVAPLPARPTGSG